MIFWIAAQAKSDGGKIWELLGVYDSEKKAVQACTEWWDCVAPVELNKTFPHESIVWKGLYYPLAREKGIGGY